MDKILRYIFVFLVISPVTGFGQNKDEIWRYEGPRIGIDLSRFLMPYIQTTTKGGFEIQADYPYKGNWFPTLEAGYLNVVDNKDAFQYSNKGPYARIGIDLNINKFESLKDNDLVFVGARYGFSHFAQETLNATYTNYWGTLQTSYPKDYLNAHWLEFLFGLKGELLPNFFLGWTVRAKFQLALTKGASVTPFVIPGLGYTSSEVPFDFSLTLSYRIPIIKTKTMPKPLKMGGSKRPDTDQDNDPDNQDLNNNQGGRSNTGFQRMNQPVF